jgi:hypothetical protein
MITDGGLEITWKKGIVANFKMVFQHLHVGIEQNHVFSQDSNFRDEVRSLDARFLTNQQRPSVSSYLSMDVKPSPHLLIFYFIL